MEIILLLAAAFLAASNGANDNFKGVATLYGSGAAGYRRALSWATLTTFGGSVAAVFLARGLLASFQGAGLVPDALVGDPRFTLSVALGAAGTVALASRLGLPVSTTHALLGALLGGGLAAAPAGLDPAVLGSRFVLPLVAGPLLALAAVRLLYPPLSRLRLALGLTETTCVCVEAAAPLIEAPAGAGAAAATASTQLVARIQPVPCRPTYGGTLLGLQAGPAVDALHFLSAGTVSFARGVNDAPKLAALALVAGGAGGAGGGDLLALLLVALAMAAGGWLGAARVARTMSQRITPMNSGQGLAANLVTAALVLFASRLGLPVSTTHVAVGAIFGIGSSTGALRRRVAAGIVGAWLLTLPLAALLAGALWLALPQ
ncbi:MAG: inorganic phosphate transporter [Gemmatimonadetes bacterium]|nr:inorganic phosphate transporter [Gemmatimonadota bacterium]